jgi:hypothetical protein
MKSTQSQQPCIVVVEDLLRRCTNYSKKISVLKRDSAGLTFCFGLLKQTDMKKALWLVAAGIGVGLLLAPRKGSETWRRIVDGLDDLKNYFLDDVDKLKESGKDAIQKGRREVTEALNEGNRAVSEAVQEW